MLLLERVGKTYAGDGHRPVNALCEVSLRAVPGEILVIRGPSGSGKTTLLNTAGGLQRPDTGRVLLRGSNPYELSPDARAALRSSACGFVFQRFHLLPYLTVRDNVLAAAEPGTSGAGEHTDELLERLGLRGRATHVPAALSTGERQRTALARALVNRPRLLLADEPTGNLDDAAARAVLAAIHGFARQGGAVVLATHDPRVLAGADCVIEMAHGRIAAVA